MLKDYVLEIIGEGRPHDSFDKNLDPPKRKSKSASPSTKPLVPTKKNQEREMELQRQRIFGCLERLYEKAGDERKFSLDEFDSRKFIGVELRTLLKSFQEADAVCQAYRQHKANKTRAKTKPGTGRSRE